MQNKKAPRRSSPQGNPDPQRLCCLEYFFRFGIYATIIVPETRFCQSNGGNSFYHEILYPLLTRLNKRRSARIPAPMPRRRALGGAMQSIIYRGRGALRSAPPDFSAMLSCGCLSDFIRRSARRIDEGNALFREVCADAVCLGVVFRLFGGGALGDELFDFRRVDSGGGLRLLLRFQ